MPTSLPDPRQSAQQEAQWIRSVPYDFFERAVDRVMFDAPWLERATLLDGLENFHAQRMTQAPSKEKYPEAPQWVEHVTAVDRELTALMNLTPRQLAIHRSMGDFLMFRGFAKAQLRQVEKCRVLYIPQTDHGQMHYKNVDDPAPPLWKADRTRPARLPVDEPVFWDGVGSGLHLDDEPRELFPLPVTRMWKHYAGDVPGAVEFLTRYGEFFGGQNFVLHDMQKRSVAIEKCSRKMIEVFQPDPSSGFTHVSGMACRNPDSPQGRHQKAMRDKYCKQFNLAHDGADRTFWAACDKAEGMLAQGIRAMGKTPRRDEVFKLFITPWPQGLNKAGAKLHPQQTVSEYTLMSHGILIDERQYFRWQRDENLVFDTQPQVFQY